MTDTANSEACLIEPVARPCPPRTEAKEEEHPWWTTAITHGGNTRRINADEFLERTGGNTPAYSDTIRATERWLPEIFFGLWLQIGDFLAHGRN